MLIEFLIILESLFVLNWTTIDVLKSLNNWKKTDPCNSNWTGVICTTNPDDNYLHVKEL